jgi:hypothetical protein
MDWSFQLIVGDRWWTTVEIITHGLLHQINKYHCILGADNYKLHAGVLEAWQISSSDVVLV